jgi:hypothetical protein
MVYIATQTRLKRDYFESEKSESFEFYKRHIQECSEPNHPKEALAAVANHLDGELADANERFSAYWTRFFRLARWIGVCNCIVLLINMVGLIELYRFSKDRKL